jgi:hypothetical protein
VAAETFKEPSQREDAKKLIKKQLEERYAGGKNKWFFQPLRVRSLTLPYIPCTHNYLFEYSSRSGPVSFGLLRMPFQNSPCVHIPLTTDATSLGRCDLVPSGSRSHLPSDTPALSTLHCSMADASHVPYLSSYALMADSCNSRYARLGTLASDSVILGCCLHLFTCYCCIDR